MTTHLERPWALILGASSGMGKATALELSAKGMNIIGVHLDSAERQPEVDELIADLQRNGARVLFFNVNAANPTGQSQVVQALVDERIHVQVLLHSLAFGTLLPFLPSLPSQPDEEIISRRQMDMTLTVMANSLVYWVQELFIKGLLPSGAKIFAMTSAGSTRVAPSYGAVSAAKCALESHVRQLAVELAPHGVAVNAIRAGVTVTPALQRIPGHEVLIERAQRFNPHGRLTMPGDVARAIALLAAADSSWITGNVIGVDGGEFATT